MPKAKRRLICPGPNPEKNGKPVGPVDCLYCKYQSDCAPRGFLFSIMQADWDDFVDGNEFEGDKVYTFGVTELTDCLRRAYFRRVEEVEPLEPKALTKMHLGAGSSTIIDMLTTRAAFVWTEIPIISGVVRQAAPYMDIIGVIDEYDPIRKVLWERKTTSIWALKNGKLPFPEHREQVLAYAHMLIERDIPVESARILYIFRDARQSDPQWYVVSVCDGEEVCRDESYGVWINIGDRARELAQSLEWGDKVPYGLPDRFDNFKCRDCPFRKQCEIADAREKNADLDGFVGGESE